MFVFAVLRVAMLKRFDRNLLLKFQRRRRDLNPRAAINDLLTFQASPFSHLGTSPSVPKYFAVS